MASIEIPSGIKVLSATTVDDLGKFDAIDEPTAVALALSSIPSVLRYIGRKVLCNGVEYVFSSIADNGLVPSATFRVPSGEGSAFVIGKERYDMEIASANVTNNILTINFKKAIRSQGSLLIKSTQLGINNPTSFTTIIDTFEQQSLNGFRDYSIYKFDLTTPTAPTGTPSFAQSDKTVNDIEIINFGLYINDSIVSYERTAGISIVTLNRDGIYDTFTGNIECSDLGLTVVNDVIYSFTRLSSTSYKITTFPGNIDIPGTDFTPILYNNTNLIIYTQSNIESGIFGVFDSMEELKRSRWTASAARGFTILGDLDWTNGSRSCNLNYSQFGWKADITGEFLPSYSTIWNCYQTQPFLIANRPRVNSATTFNHFYAQGIVGGVAETDVAFNSNQYYIPSNPSVNTHNTVSNPSGTVTITCSAGTSHLLTTGETVIINSTILGLVNASVVITVVNTLAFTFTAPSGTNVVNTTSDTNGYNYLTQAKRDTSTVTATVGNGTTATITTQAVHGYAVGNTVFIHSPILGLNGAEVVIATVPTTTSFTFANTTVATGIDTGGYSNRSIIPFLLTAERLNNNVTLTFTSAPNQTDASIYPVAVGFISGSYIRISHTGLGFNNQVFNIQNLYSTNGSTFNNVIQFKNTGTDYPATRLGTALVRHSSKFHNRSLGKSKTQNLQGWFIAGTEPANNTTDKYMYDRLRVGYYANMGSLGWNYYTLPNVPSRAYFGRHSYFGNTITEVTATDINVVSDGAFIVGNTTAVATTRKGIVKFDSTTNQLSFSDGAKYFKVNEERIKFLFEGNIGNIALTKLNSVGEVNTLMSSAVYINKATEISEIYFIIGSVAAGQTSGQITVTLQHVALGQTLEIDAATVGTTVATATYNFVNGVTISRYVKNTLSSITGSIPADRMLFAKIQTTSPFNGGANAVQDIVVTVKLR